MHLLAAFLIPFCDAINTILENVLSTRTFKQPTTMVFYISVSSALFVPLVFFFGFPTLPSFELLLYYIAVAAIRVGYLYPYFLALKVIDTSIVAALFALGQISVPIVSYFWLGEVLDFTQYIGFGIIIVCSLVLSAKGTKIPKLSKAFYYMCVAAIIRSMGCVFEKYALNTDANWINLVAYSSAFAGIMPFVFLIIGKWRRDIVLNFSPYYNKLKYFVVIEFVSFTALFAEIFALTGVSPVLTTAISATVPMFVLAMSFVVCKCFGGCLHEETAPGAIRKKVLCFVWIVLGVILVTTP